MLSREERLNRILARGEISGHSHIVIGDNVIVERNKNGEIIVEIGNEEAVLRHILEEPWLESEEQIWTEEHKDIPLKKGKYIFIQQNEYNPYVSLIKPNSSNPIKD